MKIPFLDLKREYEAIKEEINSTILKCLHGGSYILGEELDDFEKHFASWLGVKHAIGVGSGSDALHLALIASGVQPGDGVITVPNTAVPTVSAISMARAKPVFVDIDTDTYTMSPKSLREKLDDPLHSDDIKAMIVVHLYGHPADMEPIMDLANAHGLKVIEDVAQATGATYKKRKVGTFGAFGCFSFYPTKNLGAYGDGGMVCTSSDADAVKIRMLRNYGEKTKNYCLIEGYNSRLDAIQAGILKCKLKYLDEWNNIRRGYARLYDDLLKQSEIIVPVERSYARHVYHLYVIRTRHRDKLRQHLLDLGIQTAIHYPLPVHLQPAYKKLGYPPGSFPVSESYCDKILSLPLSPFTREDEIAEVAKAVLALD